MATAAKKLSQVVTHMVIGFAVAWAMTGSLVFGGLAVLVEASINVALLPLHENAWARMRARAVDARQRTAALAAEKLSQTGLHMLVAFGVMAAFTGSLALGGMAALVEPVCNVLFMPVHDRLWMRLLARLPGATAA